MRWTQRGRCGYDVVQERSEDGEEDGEGDGEEEWGGEEEGKERKVREEVGEWKFMRVRERPAVM